MDSNQYIYDAFISYRHIPHDKKIAETIQKMLELYKPPRGLECINTNKIKRIFRDQTELPTSGDLSTDIKQALKDSRYLICVCSPEYIQSKWCLDEVEYFKTLHQNQNDRILTILVSGDPSESFPEILTYEDRIINSMDHGETLTRVAVEPLAADVRSHNTKSSLKKLKTEGLRLAAPILGCSFDDLYQRHQRRKTRKILASLSTLLAFFLIYGSFAFYQAGQIKNKNTKLLENQSRYLTSAALKESENGDNILGLLLALSALPKDIDNPERPIVPETEIALRNILFRLTYGRNLSIPFKDYISSDLMVGRTCPESYAICFSPDGNKLVYRDLYGIYVCDAINGRYLYKLRDDNSFISIKFINNDCIVCVYRNEILTVKPDTGETIKRIKISDSDEYITNGVFSSDGRYIVTANSDLSLSYIDIDSGNQVTRCSFPSEDKNTRFNAIELQLSQDEKKIVAKLSGEKQVDTGYTCQLYVVDLSDGVICKHFSDAVIPKLADNAVFSNKVIYYCGVSNGFKNDIYDYSGSLLLRLPDEDIQNIAISNDSKYAAIAYRDRISIFDIENKKNIYCLMEKLDKHTGKTMVFSPDSCILAVLGENSVLYNLATSSTIYKAPNPIEFTCSDCTFSSDSRFFYYFMSKSGVDRKELSVNKPNLFVLKLIKTPDYAVKTYMQTSVPTMRNYSFCPPVIFDANTDKFALTIAEGIKIFDLQNKPVIQKNVFEALTTYGDGVLRYFSMDKSKVYINDGDILVYSFLNNETLFEAAEHQGCIDPNIIKIGVLEQNRVDVYSVDYKKLLFSFQANENLTAATFNREGKTIVLGDASGQIYICSIEDQTFVNVTLKASPIAAIIYANQNSIIGVAQENGIVSLIDSQSGTIQKQINSFQDKPQDLHKRCIIKFNNNDKLLSIEGTNSREIYAVYSMRLVSRSEAELEKTDFDNSVFLGDDRFFSFVSESSPDGIIKTLKVIDENKKEYFSNVYTSFAVSPNYKYLALFEDESSDIIIFDISDTKAKKVAYIKNDIRNESGRLHFGEKAMRFSNDGSYLVTYNEEQKPVIWDCANGNRVIEFDTMINVIISPNNKQILTSKSLYYGNNNGCIIPLLPLKEMITQARGFLAGSDNIIRELDDTEKEKYFTL